jgi:peptide deformylase
MSLLPIRRFPDPILKQPARPVERVDAHITRLIDAMVRTMRHHPRCVGLAAPQVGSPMRVAVMDASAHPKAPARTHGLLVLVNPELVREVRQVKEVREVKEAKEVKAVREAGEGMTVQREGCLSIPDFTANVRRAAAVTLAARDAEGARYELRLEGFEAIIAQHEVDHLDGVLFLDRVANLRTDVFKRKTYS